jgi:hypothetical protein
MDNAYEDAVQAVIDEDVDPNHCMRTVAFALQSVGPEMSLTRSILLQLPGKSYRELLGLLSEQQQQAVINALVQYQYKSLLDEVALAAYAAEEGRRIIAELEEELPPLIPIVHDCRLADAWTNNSRVSVHEAGVFILPRERE